MRGTRGKGRIVNLQSRPVVPLAAASLLLSFGLFAAPAGAVDASTTTVTDNSSSIATGGTLTFTATVGSATGTPVGTVGWAGVVCSSKTPLSGGVATCSIDNARASISYTATASFTDTDGNFSDSSGPDGPVSPATAPSTTAVTDNSGSIATGGILTFTATVSSASGAPVGNVTWTGVTCSSTTPLSGGVATCSIDNAQGGTHYSATATFTDTDGNYNGSSGSDGPVSPAPAASTTTVTDNSSSIVTGGTLVYTAIVGSASGTPVGVVAWSGVTCISTTPLNAGVATCSITNAQAGTSYSAAATFTDTDGRHVGSSSSDSTAAVGKATPLAPTITNRPTSGTFGGAFTAIIDTSGDGTPSVTSNTPAVCSISGLVEVTYVGVGTCSLNAQVAASANYLARTGANQTFTIGRAVPTTPTITNVPSPANEFFGFTAIVGTTGDGATSVTSNTPNVCSVGTNGLTVTFVGFGTCSLTPHVAQGVNYFGANGSLQTFPVQEASHGYWLVGSDGGIFSFGTAAFHGSTGSIPLQRPVEAITPTSTGNGYWLVASDGGIFSFGDSTYYGSLPGIGFHPNGSGLPKSLNAPIVGMVPTFTGHGYFMVASDGGVFAFGDAKFEGSCPGIGGCAGSAVAVMPDRTGNGYWLVTNVGAVYAFGDATYYGSPAAASVHVVDAVATSNGQGYWLLYANGVVANFGDATNFGAPVGYVNGFNPATTIFPTADNQGYWVASARGDVFSYGDSPYLGSMAAAGLNGEIIGAFGF